MRLTKYEHSCVLVDDGSSNVLVDPGAFSHGFEELRGLTAILITHQHHDHLDVDRLRPLLEHNRQAELFADEGSAAILADTGIEVTAVKPGDHLGVGTGIDVYGGNHAVIHPDVPVVPNVAYLFGGRFFHPGDSFTIPSVDIEILGAPTAAPWLKASEAVDYVRAVAPRIAVPIHEAVLRNPQMHYNLMDRLAPSDTRIHIIAPGDTFEV